VDFEWALGAPVSLELYTYAHFWSLTPTLVGATRDDKGPFTLLLFDHARTRLTYLDPDWKNYVDFPRVWIDVICVDYKGTGEAYPVSPKQMKAFRQYILSQ
jgi:hypothetical protein